MISRERSFAVAKRIPLETIDAAVCAQLGPARVAGNSQPAAFNRQVAMYLAKHVGGWTTTRIGKFYNGRDHSTVCHSIRRVEVMRDGDPELDALLSSMGNDLRNIGPRVPDHDESRSSGSSSGPVFDEIFIDNVVSRVVDRVVERLSAQILGRLAGNG
jgi:Bacterial dnaA protein helix-turn-helix